MLTEDSAFGCCGNWYGKGSEKLQALIQLDQDIRDSRFLAMGWVWTIIIIGNNSHGRVNSMEERVRDTVKDIVDRDTER